jgi:hypothetical protein
MSDPSTAVAIGPAIIEAVQPLIIAAIVGLVVGAANVAVSWYGKWTGQKIALSEADSAIIKAAAANEAGKIAAKLDASTFANMQVDVRSPVIAEAATNILGANASNLQAAIIRTGMTPSLVSSLIAGAVGNLQAGGGGATATAVSTS